MQHPVYNNSARLTLDYKNHPFVIWKKHLHQQLMVNISQTWKGKVSAVCIDDRRPSISSSHMCWGASRWHSNIALLVRKLTYYLTILLQSFPVIQTPSQFKIVLRTTKIILCKFVANIVCVNILNHIYCLILFHGLKLKLWFLSDNHSVSYQTFNWFKLLHDKYTHRTLFCDSDDKYNALVAFV